MMPTPDKTVITHKKRFILTSIPKLFDDEQFVAQPIRHIPCRSGLLLHISLLPFQYPHNTVLSFHNVHSGRLQFFRRRQSFHHHYPASHDRPSRTVYTCNHHPDFLHKYGFFVPSPLPPYESNLNKHPFSSPTLFVTFSYSPYLKPSFVPK